MTQTKRMQVNVKPEVVRWAISSSGWTIQDLSSKLRIKEETIEGWTSGDIFPTLNQLEELADRLKRPLAVFFLPAPPHEDPVPGDFRMLPGKSGKFDKETLLALRRARRLQDASRNLLSNKNEPLEPLVQHTTLNADPKETGNKERMEFGLSETGWVSLKNAYQAFNALRMLVEKRNIFVFQMKMPLEDARGFVLVDEMPSVIVVNSSDTIEARTFTLAHEYGHILIKESGINMPERAFNGDTSFNSNVGQTEIWCNDFASELLFPSEIAMRVFTENKGSLTDFDTIKRLSSKYKVSKSMLLYKMNKTGFMTIAQYNEMVDELIKKGRKAKKGGGGQTVEERVIRERGQKFVSLLSSNIERGFIDSNSAIDFLSIKSEDLERVMSKAEE